MTISTETRKAGPFNGNGATTVFPFEFKVFGDGDVVVVVADLDGLEATLTPLTDYTVALNPDQNATPGGSITLAVALASGYKMTVTSAVPNLQPTDITNQGGFYPQVIEDALDRHTVQIQQVAEQLGRAFKVQITDTRSADDYRDDLLQSVVDANAAATSAGSAATNAANSATAAAASQTAAAGSASAAAGSASSASTSESNAATSAASAAGSASAAAGSASAAAGSASDANASASSAASSASAAATSEGNASTSAAAALASQTAAATSATNAANSATAASGSATLAEQFAESIALVSAIAKADKSAPCLVKTGASTISIRAGTTAYLASGVVGFIVDTPVTMPPLTAGEDYSVWVHPDGAASAVADPASAPAAAPVAGALKIGGFHYGLVAPGTTVAGGSFATTGAGMIWTQTDVDKIAGINAWSIWDLRWRPAASNPRGMVLVGGQTWVDIYFCGTNHIANGTSRNNTDIASGTVLPRKPLAFGGNGTSTYSTLNWWEAAEIARAHEKRLMWQQEFVDAAFGVTEAQSIGGASATYPNTGRSAGYTSRYGIEQASGHHYTWGQDSSYRHDGTAGWAWQAVTGGRGSMYLYTPVANVRALFGGARDNAADSGSRCSAWNAAPWVSNWHIGVRAACDHLNL